jgi:hypothetical protein
MKTRTRNMVDIERYYFLYDEKASTQPLRLETKAQP